MTRLLALETSAEVCSVAVYNDGEMYSFCKHAPMKHAELLLPAVDSLLIESGLTLQEIDAIAFGRGPGSFTSLRIGVGVVQGLAWGAGIPVVPVSSLAAIAQQAADLASGPTPAVCVAVDARMQEVYAANFMVCDNTVRASGVERVCAAEQVVGPVEQPFIAAGNGFDRFAELRRIAADADECLPELWPQAEGICKLALEWLKDNEPLPAGAAQPSYVRNDVASKPKQQ